LQTIGRPPKQIKFGNAGSLVTGLVYIEKFGNARKMFTFRILEFKL